MISKNKKAAALAYHLAIDIDEALDLIDNNIYMVLTDKESLEHLIEVVEESLWAFRASFLSMFLKCPPCAVQAVQDNGLRDGNNETFKEWLELVRTPVSIVAIDAASHGGRGHFLSPYNGEEIKLAHGLLAYRMA